MGIEGCLPLCSWFKNKKIIAVEGSSGGAAAVIEGSDPGVAFKRGVTPVGVGACDTAF
jgi:hypothetical protein